MIKDQDLLSIQEVHDAVVEAAEAQKCTLAIPSSKWMLLFRRLQRKPTDKQNI